MEKQKRSVKTHNGRKALGVCTGCGEAPARSGKLQCQACATVVADRNKRNREERRNAKQCLGPCKKFWGGPYDMCDDCRTQAKISKAENVQKCRTCSNERNWPHQWCIECADRTKKERAAKVADWKKDGLCITCGAVKEIAEATNCEKDVLQAMSRRCFNTTTRWEELKVLFDRQIGICPYTKKKLVLGVNASLDHRIPKSRGGSRTIANLDWVDYNVNVAKADMLPDEFRQFILGLAALFSRASTGGTSL